MHITKEDLKNRIDADPSMVEKVVVLHGDRVNIKPRGIGNMFYLISLRPTNQPQGGIECDSLKSMLIHNGCSFIWTERKSGGVSFKEWYEEGAVVRTDGAVPVSAVGKSVLSVPDRMRSSSSMPVEDDKPKGGVWKMFGLELPVNTTPDPALAEWMVSNDNGYLHDEETTIEVMLQMIKNEPVLLKGHTGTGKTELLRNLAFQTNNPFIIIPCAGDKETSHLLGYNSMTEGSVEFIMGLLTTVVDRGGWVYFDEFNALQPDITSILNPLLDDSRCLILDEAKGEKINAHPDFRFTASCNPASHSSYKGTQTQNISLINRMTAVLVDYLPPEKEKKILKLRNLDVDAKTISNLVQGANNIRKLFKSGRIQNVMTTRDLKSILESYKILLSIRTPDQALDKAIAMWIGKNDYFEDAEAMYDQLKPCLAGVADGLKQTAEKIKKLK